MDYRKFLGSTQTMVLPYLGGTYVHATGRRLRIRQPVASGWWHFEVSGRHATPTQPAEPPELELARLPTLRGHLVLDWLFIAGDRVERIFLMPDEEPAPFTPAVARRWPSGDVLFERYEFEGEAETRARESLFERAEQMGDRKGAPPSLKAAFGFAVLRQLGVARGLAVFPLELLDRLHEVATGRPIASLLLDELEARAYTLRPGRRRPDRLPPTAPRPRTPEERASEALESAGATFINGRSLDPARYEVTFRLRGQPFIAVVDPQTFHVFDSGICLSGHDEDLGLEALPAVILEAMDTHQLHITRWS